MYASTALSNATLRRLSGYLGANDHRGSPALPLSSLSHSLTLPLSRSPARFRIWTGTFTTCPGTRTGNWKLDFDLTGEFPCCLLQLPERIRSLMANPLFVEPQQQFVITLLPYYRHTTQYHIPYTQSDARGVQIRIPPARIPGLPEKNCVRTGRGAQCTGSR